MLKNRLIFLKYITLFVMCERSSRFFKKTLAWPQLIVLAHLIISLNKYCILFLCYNYRCPLASKYSVVLVVFQGLDLHAVISSWSGNCNGQLPKLLQKTWCLLFWKTTGCNNDWSKYLLSSSLPFFHGGKIFKVATSLSIFSTTRPSLAQ